ncbi:hypothetical protein KFK09_017611 [Dendrobium nobile]|uniref:Uncharacterized protein n=1 Tax=Dendrobium nobile TaxID=94219 RepID=A0A8T3B7T7_DENNO|nr:hypothetical protein KFK09_017611 [Dendrobium nobile]
MLGFLKANKLGVVTIREAYEMVMRAGLDDLTGMDDNNGVGMTKCREAMSDDNSCATDSNNINSFLNVVLRLGV